MNGIAVDMAKVVQADIFDHPVSFNINEVTQVDTPEEALSASLNKYGYVNLGYMASRTSFYICIFRIFVVSK